MRTMYALRIVQPKYPWRYLRLGALPSARCPRCVALGALPSAPLAVDACIVALRHAVVNNRVQSMSSAWSCRC
jgi:hypothetical protein